MHRLAFDGHRHGFERVNAPTTLYRFRLDLSDVDRGVYEQLDFRVARHPSEINAYMLTRVLAYALNSQEHLAFSAQGLGDPESPALAVTDYGGRIRLWIEIGTPSARKLHKAAKVADQVKIYTYKDPKVLLKEMKSEEVHRAAEIEIVAFRQDFLERIGHELPKDARWSILVNDGTLTVNTPADSFTAELKKMTLADISSADDSEE